MNNRDNYDLLIAQMKDERSTFIPHWRVIADNLMPRRSRFTISDVNKGDRRNNKIIDTSPTLSIRNFVAGMQSGITSPARPWFRLTTPDPGLADFPNVKEWLFQVQNIMSTTFLKSNLYKTLPTLYKDLGGFGTAPMAVEEVFDRKVMNTTSFPVGSYMIAKDQFGIVNTFAREYRMTVAQCVQRFGKDGDWSNFSTAVRNAYERGLTQAWVDITMVIKPNEEFDPKKLDSKYKAFSCVYYETGVSSNGTQNNLSLSMDFTKKFLEEKGFDRFPILCPRWETTGEDVYGTDCPGMTALNDILQLQQGEKSALQAIDKMVRPPMVAPSAMKNAVASILPGDITYTDTRDGTQGFRPAHEINFRIDLMEGKQQQVRQRISKAFYEDLFLMFAQEERSDITATEVAARQQEKLLALGPVLEQLNGDMLDPLIDLSFEYHLRQGLLPPPPAELEGMELKVEYISIMAQAQKLVGTSSLERFGANVLGAMKTEPSIRDKINFDEYIDTLGDAYSLPPKIIRSTDEAIAIRQQQAQAAQKQAQMEQLQMGARAAKDLSQSSLEGDNALTALASNV